MEEPLIAPVVANDACIEEIQIRVERNYYKLYQILHHHNLNEAS